jgi:hypothetical protein
MSFGYAMDYMSSHAKGGGGAKRYHVNRTTDEDILMFGSSRMAHHYNPKMIGDSLGMTCYNCGEDGNGIIYCYGLFVQIIKRYTPKVIIYDVSGFDVEKDDLTKYVGLLKPFAGDSDVRDIIVSILPSDRLKLYSKLYRYNSTCVSLLGGMVGMPAYEGGFEPLNVVMDYEPTIAVKKDEMTEIEPTKEKYLRSMIETCKEKNIKIIFAVSPTYRGGEFGPSHPEMKKLCDEYGIAFIDYRGLKGVAECREYFKDSSHLNARGADVYTDSLITRLKPIICDR